jgi:hypothetical protein
VQKVKWCLPESGNPRPQKGICGCKKLNGACRNLVTEQLMFAEQSAGKLACEWAQKIADRSTAQEAALVKIRAEENVDKIAADQTKINCASSLCGAEGCGKRNIGQFESTTPAAMRQHCATNKHTVLDYAQRFALFLLCLPKFIATSVTTEKYVVSSCSRN